MIWSVRLIWGADLQEYESLVNPESLQLYEEDTPTQMFSCKHCETFKNSFFSRAPPVAASSSEAYLRPWHTSMIEVFSKNI